MGQRDQIKTYLKGSKVKLPAGQKTQKMCKHFHLQASSCGSFNSHTKEAFYCFESDLLREQPCCFTFTSEEHKHFILYYYYYWSFLYSAIPRSWAGSLHSHVILHEWIAFYSAFLNIHRSGVLTALAWLVPQETAARESESHLSYISFSQSVTVV